MKILLASDGSAHARIAEESLLKIPAWREAEIIVASVAVNVVPFTATYPAAEGTAYAESSAEVVEELEKHSKVASQEAADRLKSRGLNARAVVLEGNVASELLDLADHEQVDLIAVGSRGENAFVGFLLGSTARRLVAYSKVNVFVARSYRDTEPEETCRKMQGKEKLALQVCVDGSKGSELALDTVRLMGANAFSKIVVACAEPLSPLPLGIDPVSFGDTYRSDHGEAVNIVRNAEDKVRSAADDVIGVTKLGPPSQALMDIAGSQAVDIVALAATRHGFVERFLLGSVSYDVATHAPCSVLVVRGTQ